MKKWLVVILGVVVLAAGGWGASRYMGEDSEESGPATVVVERGTLVEKALATGEIVPLHEIAVKSKISGTVAKLFVAEGDYVEEGAPLLDVKPSPTPLEYAQAKRTLEMRLLLEKQRRSDLQRTKGLWERGMVSRAEYDRAEENFAQATLQRQLAAEELAILDQGRAVVAGRTVENTILSPISGHVLELQVDVGDPVVPLTSYQPGTELVLIADMNDLFFEGTVDEIDVGKIGPGMEADIELGAFPGQPVKGQLERIALKSEKKDNATVFAVEIDELQAPPEVILRAGYSANADIVIRRAEGVATLPERILHFRGDTTYVQLPATAGQEPEERVVQIGMSDGIQVEIVAGLVEGDEVLEKETREIE